MKSFIKTSVLLLIIFALTACSDNTGRADTSGITEPVETTDDHHAGETNVMPHDDEGIQKMMDDHHAGETNVMPHDHDEGMQKMMDDHHAGETDVMPHDHKDDDSMAKPPSRNQAGEDHDDTGTEPHGH